MELVPIIYDSLLFVFSLLGIVLVFSFIYSKLFRSDSSNIRTSRNIELTKQKPISKPATTSSDRNRKDVDRQERIVNRRERETRMIPPAQKVEKTLIEENKVRVVSNSTRSRSRSKRMRSDYVNSVSRYSVVNNVTRDRRVDSDLYAKFSKMSVEYSQSA